MKRELVIIIRIMDCQHHVILMESRIANPLLIIPTNRIISIVIFVTVLLTDLCQEVYRLWEKRIDHRSSHV